MSTQVLSAVVNIQYQQTVHKIMNEIYNSYHLERGKKAWLVRENCCLSDPKLNINLFDDYK